MAKKMRMNLLSSVLSVLVLLALVSYASLVIFEYDILLAIVFGNVVAHKIAVGIVGVLGAFGVISLLAHKLFKK